MLPGISLQTTISRDYSVSSWTT